jgi:hypothetical protein
MENVIPIPFPKSTDAVPIQALTRQSSDWQRQSSDGSFLDTQDDSAMVDCAYGYPKKTKKKLTKSKRTARKKVAPMKKAANKKLAKKRATSKKKLAKKKAVPKRAAVKSKFGGKKTTGGKTTDTLKKQVQGKSQSVDTVPFAPQGLGARSGQQSGDLQGLSNVQGADSESVDELLEQGNAFEAEVVKGVEDAEHADEKGVRTHEVPQDDVPGEYLGKSSE